jgi:opacity protein-like surface antigen
MKVIVTAGVATLVVLATPAFAAKSAKKTPKTVPQTIAAPAPVFTWTGCYVGGHIGGGWGHKDFSNPTGFELSDGSPAFTPSPPLFPGTSTVSLPLDQHVSGFLGGAQVGCKYQFASKWVVGVDAEFSKSRLIGTTAWNLTPFDTTALGLTPIIVPATFQAEADWLASTTAILGYSFDHLLLYGKGGVAWVHDNYDFLIIPPDLSFLAPLPISSVGAADFRESEIRTGWTAGIGLEYAFSKNISAKIEYDYYDFGTKNVLFVNQFPTGASPFGNATIKQNIQTITFGLNYYFWNPAPQPVMPAPLVTKVPMVTATASPAAADNAANAITWTQTFSSEVRYDSWRSNRPFPVNATAPGGKLLPSSGSGSELYTPYATQLTGQNNDWKIELLGRGGWVEARQTTTGLTGYVQTATDTVTSATFTYLGLQGLQPFAAVEMNLPTGLAALPANAVAAQMDPDLVDIATFGEGFNIGPTVGFNLPISNSLLLTLSAGYTHRGTFVRESALTPPILGEPTDVPAKIDPGDILTGTVSVGYQIGQLTTKLTGTISQQTSTTNVNDIPFLRAGMTYLAAGTWSYAWPGDNTGITTLSGSASHSNRNEVLFQCLPGSGCPTTLVTEPFNTNSNLYRVGLEHLFAVGQVAFGPTGSFLFRDANGYVPTTLQFVPAKQRWSAGAQVKYAPNNTLLFNARVERVWIHANETPGLPHGTMFSVLADTVVPSFAVPVVSGNGWQFVVGATAGF